MLNINGNDRIMKQDVVFKLKQLLTTLIQFDLRSVLTGK